jgi:hypothetical protein
MRGQRGRTVVLILVLLEEVDEQETRVSYYLV